MKRFFGFTVMSVVGAMLLTGILLTFSLDHFDADTEQPYISMAEPSPGVVYQYYLKDYNGYLAVFAPDESEPEMILQVFTKNLPVYDQNILKSTGIGVVDYEDLVARLEDFIS